MTALPDAPLFPQKDADFVKTMAKAVFYKPAIDAVNRAEQMLGHPGNIQRVVRAWETATSKMTNSFNHASTAHGEAAAHWDGPAYRAFSTYVVDVKSRINTNVPQLQGVANNTINLYVGVMGAYRNAITFIVKCASILLRFGGGLLDNLEDIVGLATVADGGAVILLGHVLKTLADMTDNINDLINKTIETLTGFNSAMQAAQVNMKAIKATPQPGGDINYLGSWSAQ
ncbi:hypothetical protein [Actinoallomurus sp. NPDC050550]|uniref:hypothetical protein n=1 Tax=Actinoallomurus sp. NPDC050550 TaxID=3154937 RepID=UPI0033E25DB7